MLVRNISFAPTEGKFKLFKSYVMQFNGHERFFDCNAFHCQYDKLITFSYADRFKRLVKVPIFILPPNRNLLWTQLIIREIAFRNPSE